MYNSIIYFLSSLEIREGKFEEIKIRELLKEEADKIELHSLEKMYLPPKKSIVNRIIGKVNGIK